VVFEGDLVHRPQFGQALVDDRLDRLQLGLAAERANVLDLVGVDLRITLEVIHAERAHLALRAASGSGADRRAATSG
jgi:hypothetical protein